MLLRLRSNLYWCQCAGRVVILDVEADRYFGLSAGVKEAFLALAAGQSEPPDSAPLSSLVEEGLLLPGEAQEAFPQPVEIEAPARDYSDHAVPRSRIVPVLRALAWECRLAWQLRVQPFSAVMARAQRRALEARGSFRASQSAVQGISDAADAIGFLTRAHDRCLVRGLGAHAACCASGIPVKLVIGIIAHPFAAHCWVQLDDAVIVGGYEQARLYTPILVIE